MLLVGLFAGHEAEGQSLGRSRAPLVFSPSVDEYIVEAGDTLWDISARVVGDPFAWAKVWSFNPQITNPHWIFPGDLIRFYPANLDLPRLQDGDLVASAVELRPEPEDVQDIDSPTTREAPAVETVDDRAHQPRRRRRHLRGLFVSSNELEASARLTNASPDKILLTVGDRLFFDSEDSDTVIASGETLVIYRTLSSVYHPLSNDFLGYLTERTGVAEVEGSKDDLSWGPLRSMLVEVERGQYARTLKEPIGLELTHVPAKADVDGVVVAVRDTTTSIAGYQDVIFIDKGSDDGLKDGNHVLIWHQGDPKTGRVDGLPFEQIGRAIVVETQAGTATCLVLYARQEIVPGAPFRTVLTLKQ